MAASNKPKFYYFQGRGKGEMIRLTCAAAGIEFDEISVTTREDYLKLIEEGKLLFKQLPLFEIDGLTLVGSDSIVRYVARKADLYGQTNADKTRIDILVMGAKDLFDYGVGGYLFGSSPEKFVDEKVLPLARNKYLPAFEKTLAENGSGYMVGSSLTIADILVFDCLTHCTESPLPQLASVLKDYPKCDAFVKFIASHPKLKDYVPTRYPIPTAEYIHSVKSTLLMK
ncbi:glutathione S-transferase alpha-4-like [Diadema antillarum]|uniref:glutathione S-transferase alpha-4-like n=1 Tax=Diadema antillarum TaxID=105358 RepID=UPI003A84C3D8